MNKFVKYLCFPFDNLCIGLVWLYKIFISPCKPKTCRYYPTCSTYMIFAIREYHFVKGIWIGFKRLLRCRPKYPGGFDPLPLNLKGDLKWIL